jgi:hypothetical protein
MSINTYSAFTYGHTITEDNQWINFSENGIDELSAQIDIGAYTLGEFASKVASALNEVGTLNYTCEVNRETLKLTISADSNYWIYVTTGTNVSISAYGLMGYSTDRSNVNNQEGDNISGSVYEPQTPLQKFVDFDDNVKFNQSSVNESASGVVEVVSYGTINMMECEIPLCTDITPQLYIKENASGVADVRAFMLYAISKAPIEFIPNYSDGNKDAGIVECILEKTPEDSKGTGFKLKEQYAKKLIGYYSTGKLMFRKLI